MLLLSLLLCYCYWCIIVIILLLLLLLFGWTTSCVDSCFSVNGHLGCFHVVAAVSDARCSWTLCAPAFDAAGCLLRGGIAGSYEFSFVHRVHVWSLCGTRRGTLPFLWETASSSWMENLPSHLKQPKPKAKPDKQTKKHETAVSKVGHWVTRDSNP